MGWSCGSAYILLAIVVAAGSTCEQWCEEACAELNGDLDFECGSCPSTMGCHPGAPGFPRPASDTALLAALPPSTEHARHILLPAIEATLASGGSVRLDRYTGVATIVVNTATGCGFADETFRALNALHKRFASRGLAVLAFASDDFHQEPGSAADIEHFARSYGAGFEVFDKVAVTGDGAHPLFAALAAAAGTEVRWNYEAFLLDHTGLLRQHWQAGDLARANVAQQIEGLLGWGWQHGPPSDGDIARELVTPTGSMARDDTEAATSCSFDRVTAEQLESWSAEERSRRLEAQPHVVTGLMDHWAAMDNWSNPAAFSRRFGAHQLQWGRFRSGTEGHVNVSWVVEHSSTMHTVVVEASTCTAARFAPGSMR